MDLPIHPMMAHFPIAFYVLEFLFLGFWFWKKDEAYIRFALFVFRLALLGTLAAVISGWLGAGGWKNIVKHTLAHFRGAVAVLIFQSGRGVLWHTCKCESPKKRWLLWVTALLGLALVFYTAHEGGELVYKED